MGAAASVRAAVDTPAILPNFSIMRRPLIICLPTETSNKAQAGISRPLSRDISRYGKFEDRRDPRPSAGKRERAATSAAPPCKLGWPVLAPRALIQRWPVDDRDALPNSAQVSPTSVQGHGRLWPAG